jgi:Flp pilus assembly protein TadD
MSTSGKTENPGRRTPWLAALAIVTVAVIAYANSFSVPFVFDDDEAIVNNPAIRHLWPPHEVLFGGQDGGMTGNGRPVLNLTLAINHALGGKNVRGYHALNLLIHVAAALALFGLVLRTLRQRALVARWGPTAETAALLAAVLWLAHPLQTESVTYIVQRAESLAGLCCLLTLLFFVRSADARRPWLWQLASAAACLLGMASKEVMVAAPLLVLLYDRTFVAGSFRAAWRARWRYHLALAATWLPLAWLVVRTGGRGDSAGFGTAAAVWPYLLTQCAAIIHYLRLTVWPHPLVLDYGDALVRQLAAVWWQALLVGGLLAATGWALVRRPAWGFAGAWFFALLAPSSSFVPIATQTMAEHRMYLALAAPMTLGALALCAGPGRRGRWAGAAVALAFVGLTFARNADYASRLAIWTDTVARRPDNARAHNNLGIELSVAGRHDEAMAHFTEALRQQPDRADARNNLANELLLQGRLPEAIAQFEATLRVKPDDILALGNLGVALLQSGRLAEAAVRYERLLSLDPTDASAQGNLGYILLQAGRAADALPHYRRAAELQPGDAAAEFNLAVALARTGRNAEALAHCEAALRANPELAAARELKAQLSGRSTNGGR